MTLGDGQTAGRMNRQKTLLLGAVLLVVTAIAFLPSLRNGFTNWDDWQLVTQNEDIRELSLDNTRTVFSSYYVGTYVPLTMLSFAVDYHFWKLDPFPYHLTNFALHLLNCALVFLLLLKLTRNPVVAFVTALFFALHPLRVESVAWIAGRKDLLYALFFLGSMIGYLRYRESGQRGIFVLSLVLFALSALSKGLAITLPFALILCDYLENGRIRKADVTQKIPFFALTILFGAIAFLAQGTGQGWGPEYPLLSMRNILVGCYTFIFYLWKTAAPFNLSCIYPHPEGLSNPFAVEFLASCLLTILLAVLVLYSTKQSRKVFFAVAFFVVTLLPVLQFFPVGGQAIAADRYTYVPAIGLAYLAAELLRHMHNRLRTTARKAVLNAGIIVLFAGMSFLTWQRCLVWRDDITLWSDVIEKHPDVATAWFNRACALEGSGDYDRAFEDLTRAIERGHVEACINRGLIHHSRGDFDKAIADYDMAIGRRPDFAIARYNRGNANLAKGSFRTAVSDYDQAIRLNPSYTDSRLNRGTAFFKLQEYDRAIADFSKVLELEPGNEVALRNRQACLAKKGKETANP